MRVLQGRLAGVKMGSDRRWFLAVCGVLPLLVAIEGPAQAQTSVNMRWDIISVDFATGTAIAGGSASALANDRSEITLTGSGFFRKTPQTTRFSAIAKQGGGNWETFDNLGNSTGSGTYRVLRGPANFQLALGTPPLPNDTIGLLADARAGLLLVDIKYSDGDRGILVLSCHLDGTPNTVFEGITATKGFTDYWVRLKPVPMVDGNRTVFHIVE